ncbi:MAG: transglutaminaseTgpA domain-containing protein [Candidatus Limnocylindria bacterium]
MPDLRERLLRPRPGWLSLGLLGVMLLALTWSVQGAAWLDQLDFLGPVALWAILFGAILGILPISVAAVLPIGALLGGWIVLWTIGGEYYPALDQAGRLFALRDDAVRWTIVVLRTGYPAELSPYAIGLGALMWTTGFMAAYAVYRHSRVLDAILLVGAALIINMSATYTDLFAFLLLFVLAALLLWLRAALVSRQEGWLRRRVNENLDVPASIMRSGLLFAAGSVALAWVLTSVAVAAPLTGAWRSLDPVWTDVRDQFEGVFGSLTNPQSRITGNSFGSSFTVSGSWISNDQEVMVIAASQPLYMRTATYDVYTGRGWERSDGAKRQIGPGEAIFPGPTPERPTAVDAFEIETISVEMRQTIGRNLFTPGFPLKIFTPAAAYEPASLPFLGGFESANPFADGEGYQVSAALSHATQAELAAAGTEYPEEIRALYLDDERVTDRVRELAMQVTEGAPDPYARAEALARFLSRDERFTYATDAPVPAPGVDLVDFFLFADEGQVGYCQYYASAMVVMARALGIPARVAVGFAPGERLEDDTFLVTEANAHAWAELYFPGYGWEIFEATKTIESGFIRPTGEASDGVTPPIDPNRLRDFELGQDLSGNISTLPSFVPGGGGIDASQDAAAPADQAREGNALVILALVLGAAAFLWWRMRRFARRWRLLPAGDRTWQSLAVAADRAGVGPRPSETIYEYSGWLEDQIPARRPEIRTVADGKVWQSYSGRPMNRSAASRLDAAWERLRLPLLWLAIRRGLRNLVRRRP